MEENHKIRYWKMNEWFIPRKLRSIYFRKSEGGENAKRSGRIRTLSRMALAMDQFEFDHFALRRA